MSDRHQEHIPKKYSLECVGAHSLHPNLASRRTRRGCIVTQDEAGLFAVAAAFGAGFSGIIPAYVSRRRSVVAGARLVLCQYLRHGGWLAGAMYDQFGSYAPAFAAGVVFNIANIAVIGWLAARIR
jgi:hypothetical protein